MDGEVPGCLKNGIKENIKRSGAFYTVIGRLITGFLIHKNIVYIVDRWKLP
jgi:hypothetical protein